VAYDTARHNDHPREEEKDKNAAHPIRAAASYV